MTEELTPQQAINRLFEQKDAAIELLEERLNQVQAMMDADEVGWTSLMNGIQDQSLGLSLSQLKEWSAKIQEYLVGNPIIKRGSGLRASYVWSKGVKVPGAMREPGKRGAKTALEEFYTHPKSQAYLFSSEANDEMERSAVASGMYLLAGDDRSKRILHPIPVGEIAGILTNPDYNGEVWAYLREWNSLAPNGDTVTRKEWIYTDRFTGVRKPSIKDHTGNDVAVSKGKTAFDQTFNSQTGWPLGVPDALSAIVWARIYSELMNHGKVMTESLAKFAFKVTQGTQRGANNVGVKMSKGGSGQTAVVGTGNDLTPLSNAGKAYDFNGIRAIAAQVATALEVSIVHLLSDPGAAGSSYGSASNLDLPTKRAMVSRQNLWASYIERILKWATGKDIDVTFPPLDDDPYRAVQALALIWNTGLVHEDEMRDPILEMGGITAKHEKAPENVLLPNNSDSWERADIDPSDDPGAGKQAASPDQGVSNSSGGTDSALSNDMRTDTIGEMLKRMSDEAFIERLESIAAKFDSVKTD